MYRVSYLQVNVNKFSTRFVVYTVVTVKCNKSNCGNLGNLLFREETLNKLDISKEGGQSRETIGLKA